MIAGGWGKCYQFVRKTVKGARTIPLLLVLGAVQLVGMAIVGLFHPWWFADYGWLRSVFVGVLLGCGFAEVSMAAAWAALGPFRAAIRIPSSLCWMLMIGLLILYNVVVGTASGNRGHAAMEGLTLAGGYVLLWFVVQLPLWLARVLYRFRLDVPGDAVADGLAEHQFGIRQLLIVTAVIAVALGAGRLLVEGMNPESSFQKVPDPDRVFLIIVGLFLVSNSLVAFVVVTGTLLARRWLLALVIGVVAAGIITVIESSMVLLVPQGFDGFWQAAILIATINATQFCWLAASLLLLRSAGYRLLLAFQAPGNG